MEYETLSSEYVDYGNNKFIEVSKKRVLPDGATFLNLSKGYYAPNGEKRYQKAFGFPIDETIIKSLVEKLQNISTD